MKKRNQRKMKQRNESNGVNEMAAWRKAVA
jgi:hypothetical protein